MTIIAGFKTQEGIVLCSDTQETIGAAKRNVPKIRVELAGTNNIGPELGVAFCGATNEGSFVDMLIDEAWASAKDSSTVQGACDRILRSIKATYREYVHLYQPGYVPEVDLIFGVKMNGESRLFYGRCPAIHEKHEYATGGVGHYMADFLAARMWHGGLTLRQAIILAAYILFEAKEHVAECGGDSQIAVLREHASSGLLGVHRIEALTSLVESADSNLGPVLLAHADLTISKDDFLKQAQSAVDILDLLRETKRKEVEDWDKFWDGMFGSPTDDLGLPASDSDNNQHTNTSK